VRVCSLRHGENRNRFVDLAGLVDVFRGIGIPPAALDSPSKGGSKVADHRVKVAGFSYLARLEPLAGSPRG
jgi:hypothetical protein